MAEVCDREGCEHEARRGERYCGSHRKNRTGAGARRRRTQLERRKRRHRRYKEGRFTPYEQFERAAKPRAAVGAGVEAQERARAFVERGGCGYENARGELRDVGVPKDPRDRGRVFSKGSSAD